jgi:hypothetical protein
VKLGNNGEEMLQEACGLEVMSRLIVFIAWKYIKEGDRGNSVVDDALKREIKYCH